MSNWIKTGGCRAHGMNVVHALVIIAVQVVSSKSTELSTHTRADEYRACAPRRDNYRSWVLSSSIHSRCARYWRERLVLVILFLVAVVGDGQSSPFFTLTFSRDLLVDDHYISRLLP
ncbi:hypothetical protein ARMSODRAFT_351934 [Armillaria solidipes]|uniref:Secreted protein n=1 Tax=Armillaria solidipes TaxID=1076256 RepID=A0A2H3BPW8_9AGAR|nr:hypothetical protein ARMSODRAFT_351934 [Armillaria solidipes]